jgi:branched-chain amino acid transport system ATP-binding protein
MNAIAGLVSARNGIIRLEGRELQHLRAHERVRHGIALVPQGRRLFAGMTVDENLLAGAHTLPSRRKIEQRREEVFAIFPRLQERRRQVVGTLSGGEQQMCAIARSVMSSPQVLLIDELSLGLAPVVVEDLLAALERIRARGTALLVVEQDVDSALRFAARAYVLQLGHVVLQGAADQVRAEETFAASYMGL